MVEVRAHRRFEKHAVGRHIALKAEHPSIIDGRTMFLKRAKPSASAPRLLISGVNNKKIGSHVTKGWMRGRPIFTLTLEERATCPRSCLHWVDCYGNSVHWPNRWAADADLMPRLSTEVAALCGKHKQGILIRLHVLGDFFSREYVHFWGSLLREHDGLSIFGYSAWQPETEIGEALWFQMLMFGRRFMVRFSDGPSDARRTISVESESEGIDRGAIVCPAQTGRSPSCGDCCLCLHTDRPIGFIGH